MAGHSKACLQQWAIADTMGRTGEACDKSPGKAEQGNQQFGDFPSQGWCRNT